MPRKSTTEEFIRKIKEVHGNRYDYSMVDYIDERMRGHNRKGPVFEFSKKYGIKIPTPIQLTDYIHKDDAVIKEGLVLNEYKNSGWNILNKYATGGLGGLKTVNKLTYDECVYKLKEYTNITDFRKNNEGLYRYILKNKQWNIKNMIYRN